MLYPIFHHRSQDDDEKNCYALFFIIIFWPMMKNRVKSYLSSLVARRWWKTEQYPIFHHRSQGDDEKQSYALFFIIGRKAMMKHRAMPYFSSSVVRRSKVVYNYTTIEGGLYIDYLRKWYIAINHLRSIVYLRR